MTYFEPLDDASIPVSCHWVPNVGFVPIQGSSTINTDSAGKTSSPVNMNFAQVGTAAFALGQNTKMNSLPVTLASDQAVNMGTPIGSVVSVGISSTSVLSSGALATAKFLLLTNDSTSTIYLNISGGAATLNAGVRLNANGGSIFFDRYVPSAAITAISSVINSNLLVEVG